MSEDKVLVPMSRKTGETRGTPLLKTRMEIDDAIIWIIGSLMRRKLLRAASR